jgi:hypothetical protein
MQNKTETDCEVALRTMFDKTVSLKLEVQELTSYNEKLVTENIKIKKALDDFIEALIIGFNKNDN